MEKRTTKHDYLPPQAETVNLAMETSITTDSPNQSLQDLGVLDLLNEVE